MPAEMNSSQTPSTNLNSSTKAPLTVGIVGGGIAGLYTALLLRARNIPFHIFEGTNRLGGRVFTHYFSPEKDQFYEAGAMRIPDAKFQGIFFDLVKYVNTQVPEERRIKLIDYVLTMPGNEMYIRGIRREVGASAADVTPQSIGWEVPNKYKDKSVRQLLMEPLAPFEKILDVPEDQFEEVFFEKVVKPWDNYSFRYYLRSVLDYPTSVIDFVETAASQTNQFALSIPELIMQSLDFGTTSWKTIEGGMSRLPEAMGRIIGLDNVTFGARVVSLEKIPYDRVKVIATGYNGLMEVEFDKVVLAIPPAALKMLVSRPLWSVEKEMAIRSMHFEALYKMGLRFKTRFWERVELPAKGGQTTTDLPIRWIVFPSNGIGSDETGVLLVYAWMTDATTWLPLSPIERRSLALQNLEEVYRGRLGESSGRPITVADLLIETCDVAWSQSTATGDAMFLPGQFESRFRAGRKPEDDMFYFAGEHISVHHTWIAGAADSALWTVRRLLNDNTIPRLSDHSMTSGTEPSLEHTPFRSIITARDPLLFHLKGHYHHEPSKLPISLGDGSVHVLGPQICQLRGSI